MKLVLVGFMFASMASAECLNMKDIRRMQSIFDVRTVSDINICDPRSVGYRVYEALIFLEGLKFGGPRLEEPFNYETLPDNWFHYLRRLAPEVHSFRFDEYFAFDGTCDNVSAYVRPTNYPNTMFFCSSLGDTSVVEMVEALIHEARHLQIPSRHVVCQRGAHSQRNACDNHPRERKAFGIGLEAMGKIVATATNVHPAAKEFARELIRSRIDHSFNEPVDNRWPKELQMD